MVQFLFFLRSLQTCVTYPSHFTDRQTSSDSHQITKCNVTRTQNAHLIYIVNKGKCATIATDAIKGNLLI